MTEGGPGMVGCRGGRIGDLLARSVQCVMVVCMYVCMYVGIVARDSLSACYLHNYLRLSSLSISRRTTNLPSSANKRWESIYILCMERRAVSTNKKRRYLAMRSKAGF